MSDRCRLERPEKAVHASRRHPAEVKQTSLSSEAADLLRLVQPLFVRVRTIPRRSDRRLQLSRVLGERLQVRIGGNSEFRLLAGARLARRSTMYLARLSSRYALPILLLAAFLSPIVVLLAGRAVKSNRNDMSEWLPASYEETAQLGWFRKRFAADQFVIISWNGCTVGDAVNGLADDPRIERLVRALRNARLPANGAAEGPACFDEVTTGRQALGALTSPPLSLSDAEARERLRGALIGPDGKQTCVLATLAKSTEHRLRDVVGRPTKGPLGLREAKLSPLYHALAQAGIRPDEVRLGGPPIDNVSIDEEGERTLVRLALLAGGFGAALAWWSLRSLQMTVVVFACGVACAGLSLAIVPLTGGAVDAILMSMPALVYVLAVSGAIHFINYYRLAAADNDLQRAVDHAVSHAWRPALLCSVTTAIGLASLATSDIVPICRFGLYSAAAVMATLAVLFVILPAIMRVWPWQPPVGSPDAASATAASSGPGGFWARYTHRIAQHRWLVIGGSLAAIVLLMAGLPRVSTTIDLLKLFSSDARLVADYRWFEQHLGRLVPMEVVVRFPGDVRQESLSTNATLAQLVRTQSFRERLHLIELIETSVLDRLGPGGDDLVGACISAATFAQSAPNDTMAAEGIERYVVAEELLKHRHRLIESGYLYEDAATGEELWRISLRVAAFHGIDHGQLVERLKGAVEPVLAAQRSSDNAVRALAARRDELPRGSRVAVICPSGADAWMKSLGSMLRGRRFEVAGVVKPIGALTEAEIDSLQSYDGAIVSGTLPADDQRRLDDAEIQVLATRDSQLAPADGSGVGVVYTGAVPIVYKAQRELLNSLIQSTWWSFATITPLMMFVCRSLAAGAIVMIPNTLPVLVVFGGMGWLGVPVDIGSMMAASIALGVAVDDTIHFLAWFREDLVRLGDRGAAVEAAYARSATPTLQAALINGLGLSVFATSSFTPTQRFGWLMLAILVAGVVAELVMLPAILFSPLGKAFERRRLKVIAAPVDHSAGDSETVRSA